MGEGQKGDWSPLSLSFMNVTYVGDFLKWIYDFIYEVNKFVMPDDDHLIKIQSFQFNKNFKFIRQIELFLMSILPCIYSKITYLIQSNLENFNGISNLFIFIYTKNYLLL